MKLRLVPVAAVFSLLGPLALVAAPGTADTAPPPKASPYTSFDGTGDVRMLDADAAPTDPGAPVPDRTEGDIRRIDVNAKAVSSGRGRVGIYLYFRALSRSAKHEASVRVQTPRMTRLISFRPSAPTPADRVVMTNLAGTRISCDIGSSLSTGGAFLVFAVPRPCLDEPTWVRVGVVTASISNGNRYVDDARSQQIYATPVLGPRITTETPVVPCAQLRNQRGITSTTITVANISDLSGPFPNLFRRATQSARAFVNFFNATESICGRKLKLLALDTHGTPEGEKAATITACQQAFAAIGSASTVDDGGAARAQLCGLPDLRALSMTEARYDCTTCFSTHVDAPRTFENAVPDYYVQHYPVSTQDAALLYLNAEPWRTRAETMGLVEQARGFQFDYSHGIDIADFNYGPYVAQLISNNIKFVQFVGPRPMAKRLADAMAAADFTPTVYLLDPLIFDYADVAGLGPSANFPANFSVPSFLSDYAVYLQKAAPGASLQPVGVYAWSAAALFAKKAQMLGGALTRANLVAAVREVYVWHGAAGGFHVPQNVGQKLNGNCWQFWRPYDADRWLGPDSYFKTCKGATTLAAP